MLHSWGFKTTFLVCTAHIFEMLWKIYWYETINVTTREHELSNAYFVFDRTVDGVILFSYYVALKATGWQVRPHNTPSIVRTTTTSKTYKSLTNIPITLAGHTGFYTRIAMSFPEKIVKKFHPSKIELNRMPNPEREKEREKSTPTS